MRSPLLDSLPPPAKDHLLRHSTARTLRPGDRLWLAGDSDHRVHLLRSGLLKLIGNSGSGRETIVCLALPGEVVGETAALDGRGQPLDVVAAIRSELCCLERSALLHTLEAYPQTALELVRLMARRTRWVVGASVERNGHHVPARLAGRLLDLAAILGAEGPVPEFELPLPQGDLGKLAGMSRESVCKTLRSFQEAGLLVYRRHRLRLLRVDVLEKIRCSES